MRYKNRLDIPYTKLTFELELIEGTTLPYHKVSMFRGGMGEMLLRNYCIQDRLCQNCSYEEECVINHVLYTKMNKKPKYITSKDSIGYLIECDDYQTNFSKGERLSFALILFGKNIVNFPLYLQAFHMLGSVGIGKNKTKYQISSVWNERDDYILYKNQVNLAAMKANNVMNYIEQRKLELGKCGSENIIEFLTPTTLKFQGKYISTFESEAFLRAVFRRIQMLDCFLEKDIDCFFIEEYPRKIKEKSKRECVKRFSNRKGKEMKLIGLTGIIRLEDMSEEVLSYALAGELLHIGKNTSFGFGKYRVR